jgi:hypothetical protein
MAFIVIYDAAVLYPNTCGEHHQRDACDAEAR